MRVDVDLLNGIERRDGPPTLRFFRFKEPTVSYGRLQKLVDIAALVPAGWDIAQRPTGGGVVFHNTDLCLSLSWTEAHGPLPKRRQEQYRWIHAVILEALSAGSGLRMAACSDVSNPAEPFSKRTCFKNPVGYDLVREEQKMVGGALWCTRRSTLYQGSIQLPLSKQLESQLFAAFERALNPSHA
jgi:lipoate-protein ligase A